MSEKKTATNDSSSTKCVDLGAPVEAISADPTGCRLACGGRDVLKIVSVVNDTLVEVRNLRSGNRKQNLTYSCTDIKWHPQIMMKNLVATSSTNGCVVIWDVDQQKNTALQQQVMKGHDRTVNCIAWHPIEPDTLASGSQDGTIKLWDIRSGTCTRTLNCHDSVRDISFSPFWHNYLAVGLENGSLQVWDTKKPDGYVQNFVAHQGLVLTLDWHPDNKDLLASGGRDKTVKVWNLNNTHKAEVTVQTIASVGKILWRPNRMTQIATCANVFDKNIHLWDTSRPHIPLVSLGSHTDFVTGLHWSKTTVGRIISCSKDGTVRCNELSQGYHHYNHVRTVGLTFGCCDELAIVQDHLDRGLPRASAVDTKARPIKNGIVRVLSSGVRSGHLSGFKNASFRALAENYVFESANIVEACAFNSKVADEAGEKQLSDMWAVLELLLEDLDAMDTAAEAPKESLLSVPVVDVSALSISCADSTVDTAAADVSAVGSGTATPELETVLVTDELSLELALQDRNESDAVFHAEDPDEWMGGYVPSILGNNIENQLNDFDVGREESSTFFEPDHSSFVADDSAMSTTEYDAETTQHSEAPPFSVLNAVPATPWDLATVLGDLLEFYSERGDVQTCVVLCILLRPVLTSHACFPELNETRVREWYLSYIELLQRLRLWVCATKVIRLSTDIHVLQLHATSTTIHTSCPQCRKPMEKNGSVCEKCAKHVSFCSICREPVRGLYVWCQGCGHGGHLAHMRQWFHEHSECPAGCSHVCNMASSLSSAKAGPGTSVSR